MSKQCSLIIDKRERNVYRHVDAFADTRTEHKQITVGDYVVLDPDGKIIVVIERKSLDDFGASIKDGRIDNQSKLNNLREQTGCKIIYIVEGPAFPKPADYFANIAYKNIQSCIFHLMVRDGISVIQTLDTYHTAQTLAAFVKSMTTLYERSQKTTKKVNAATAAAAAGAEVVEVVEAIRDVDVEKVAGVENAADNAAENTENIVQNVPELLTQKYMKTDYEIAREMWGCFPGIAAETSPCFIERWSIADVVNGVIKREELLKHRTSTGRQISKKVVTGLIMITRPVAVKLLSVIYGVSVATSKAILGPLDLRELIGMEKDAIARIVVGKGSVGAVRAGKILHHFNYKYQCEL